MGVDSWAMAGTAPNHSISKRCFQKLAYSNALELTNETE